MRANHVILKKLDQRTPVKTFPKTRLYSPITGRVQRRSNEVVGQKSEDTKRFTDVEKYSIWFQVSSGAIKVRQRR